MRRLLILSVAPGLMGCSNLVPSSLLTLRGLSPLEADPAGFVIKLDLPDGVEVAPGSAQLALLAERSDTGQALADTFVLAETQIEEEKLYRVADQDLAELRDLQARINAWETENADATTGSLSVSLTGCAVMAGPADDATVSVALRLEENQPFLPLLDKAPLKAILAKADAEDLQPCS